MKRDMSLVRELLLEIEKGHMGMVDGLDYPNEKIVYHVKIMNDFGLIEAEVHDVSTLASMGRVEYALGTIAGLTWEGYDFLDDIRDETVWKKTLTQIKKTTGTASLEMVKEVAQAIARTLLLSGLG